ncbi:MAG: hypothetical protein WBG90_17505 [Saonia sp.]
MKLSYHTIALLSILLLLSCGGGDSGGDAPDDPDPVLPPLATTLVFPEDNTECNEGEVLNETRSTVTFRWNASQNTDSYEVNLRNLNTDVSTKTTATNNESAITIDRGAPYEWFVISRANGTTTTASSPTERFYNQGPGVENYAPFPAEVVNPGRGATIDTASSVSLQWNGSDVDDDIVEFQVLFDTNSNPTTVLATTTDTTTEATIVSGQVYFWRVITKDSEQNTSQSEIFEFRVN